MLGEEPPRELPDEGSVETQRGAGGLGFAGTAAFTARPEPTMSREERPRVNHMLRRTLTALPLLLVVAASLAGCADYMADDALHQDLAQLRQDVAALRLANQRARGDTDALGQLDRRTREQAAENAKQIDALSTRLDATNSEMKRLTASVNDLSQRVETLRRQPLTGPTTPPALAAPTAPVPSPPSAPRPLAPVPPSVQTPASPTPAPPSAQTPASRRRRLSYRGRLSPLRTRAPPTRRTRQPIATSRGATTSWPSRRFATS